MEELIQPALRTNEMAVRAGLPDRSNEIRSVMNSIQNQPSPHELAEQEAAQNAIKKLKEERAKNQATLEMKLQEAALGLNDAEKTAFLKNLEFAFNKNVPLEQRQTALRFVEAQIARAQGAGEPHFSLEVDAEGNIRRLDFGPAGPLPGKIGIGGSDLAKLDAQSESVDAVLDTVASIKNVMAQNPELFGTPGSVSATAQDVSGILEDLATTTLAQLGITTDPGSAIADFAQKMFDIAPDDAEIQGDIEDKFLKPLSKPNAGTIDVLETTLKFALLEAETGGRRPLKIQIEEINELVELRGLKSQARIQGRLEQIERRVKQRQSAIQRRKERGVTGVAKTPQASASPIETNEGRAAPESAQENIERLQRDLTELLRSKQQ